MNRILLLLCCVLWSPFAAAQELAVSAEGGAGFQRLISFAQQGRLGADVTNANVAVSKTSVRVDLITSAGKRSVLLLPPGQEGRWSSRFFNLDLGDGGRAEDAERLMPLLDESFAGHDPFVVVERGVRDATATQGVEPLSHAWKRDGWRGVRTGIVLRSRQPVGPRYVVAWTLLYALGIVVSLGIVLRAKVREPR